MNRLTLFMIRRGMTPQELAKHLGLGRRQIHRYLAGTHKPSFTTATRISEKTEGFVTPNDWTVQGSAAAE